MLDPLDQPYAVAPETVEAFRRDGYVRMEGLLDPDAVARHGAAVTAATLRLNGETRSLDERDVYGRAFLQVMNLWERAPECRPLIFSRRLAGVAAALLGVRSVRLYHDQSLYKEPGGGLTPAHADQYYWPLATDRTVTAWIPLQPTPDEMGPLAFYRGSHEVAFGRDLAISDESEAAISAEMEARGFPIDVAPFAAGDVSFHLGWTFHRAGPNRSDRPRSVMTVIYMDADARVAAPVNAMQESDLRQWLPGLKPGDPAASALNPVLF